MALKPCKGCSKEVSTKAKTCPNCGIKNPGGSAKNKFVRVFGLIVIVLVAIAVFGGDSEEAEYTTEKEEIEEVVVTQKPIETQSEPIQQKPTVVLLTSSEIESWPLTVDEVRAVCFYMPKVVFRVGGVRGDYYALNNAPTTVDLRDMGVDLVQMTPDLDVWADDPNNPGAKIDISALSNKIKEICE
jgi:RNA polymerase subunit RPABC4/transcription elongation factor Spt4